MPEKMNKPVKFVVVWHELCTDADGDQMGVSERFCGETKAENWLSEAVAAEVGCCLLRDHHVTVTWSRFNGHMTARLEEDCGHEITYQVVVLTNDD